MPKLNSPIFRTPLLPWRYHLHTSHRHNRTDLFPVHDNNVGPQVHCSFHRQEINPLSALLIYPGTSCLYQWIELALRSMPKKIGMKIRYSPKCKSRSKKCFHRRQKNTICLEKCQKWYFKKKKKFLDQHQPV